MFQNELAKETILVNNGMEVLETGLIPRKFEETLTEKMV